MSETTILRCSCEHEYQNRIYGEGMRVHNYCTNDSEPKWRCTVCGTKRDR